MAVVVVPLQVLLNRMKLAKGVPARVKANDLLCFDATHSMPAGSKAEEDAITTPFKFRLLAPPEPEPEPAPAAARGRPGAAATAATAASAPSSHGKRKRLASPGSGDEGGGGGEAAAATATNGEAAAAAGVALLQEDVCECSICMDIFISAVILKCGQCPPPLSCMLYARHFWRV